ncbi:hypothetical protein ACOMHN_000523 [Nucella lapillus]
MSHIKTFARLKPTEELYDDFEINGKKTFSLRVPELLRDYGTQGTQNCYPTISYDFQFDRVFDTSVSQEEVYTITSKDIVTGFLDGFNGTIFAYGQTGTGKTYTVEGSPLRYSDRGLASRALMEIYKSLEKRENEDITVSISYLEIYQEVAYDLLSTTARTSSPVTVFPRVTVVEGPNGTCAVRNLSVHLAASEAVASGLLLQGQANRQVAETPVNQHSSRSHAVFTIYLQARAQGAHTLTRSKLHLVDLAGSERVAKTGVDGQQLTEAKSINLSLHHLEGVIIALQADTQQARPRSTPSSNTKGNTSLGGRPTSSEGTRCHVPYRNSLLTMVLRDSLGGNCQTSMIATISLEVQNLGETLSTCRFAQRVACIANHARRNEEIDDKTLIQQLKRRVAELETQMACLKMSLQSGESGEEGGRKEEDDDLTSSKLTDEDKLSCAQVVQEYLAGRISDPVTAGVTNPFKFRECLRILKRMVMSRYFQDKLAPTQTVPAVEADISRTANQVSGSAVASRTNQNAEKDRKGAEVQRHVQILEEGSPEEGTSGADVQPVSNGVMDTDELILNIQRLYAATRKEQHARQQGLAAADLPGTPPKMSGRRPEAYKSPYEQKREKEIRKLSRRLETMKQTQSAQEQQLQEMRTSTAFGQLTGTEVIVKNKIQVTREQIADQHAYLLHLRHTEASPEVLQQEKLVEDQLIKREAKFQKKLDEAQQKKAEMEAQITQGQGSEDKDAGDGQGQTKPSSGKRSLEDQFSQYKKRNGTLNTRQASYHTEAEKKFLMSKQVALKEEATREKLRELKEMMRRSRQDALLGHAPPPNFPFGVFGGGENPAPFFGAWADTLTPVDDKHPPGVEANGQSFSETFVVEDSENPCLDLALHDLENGRGPDEDGSGLPPQSSVIVTSGAGSTAEHASHKIKSNQNHPPPVLPEPSHSRADQMWESVYSCPSTPHSQHSQGWVDPPQADAVPTSHTNRDGVLSGLTAVSSPELITGERHKEGAGSQSSEGSAENVSSDLRASSLHGRVEGVDRSKKTVEGGARTRSSDTPAEKRVHSKAGEYSRVNGSSAHNHTDVSVDGVEDFDQTSSSSPVSMPSEYIHRMDTRDKFDARKMGLSSKTFDSALSSMLNDESKPVSYGLGFYDKFAREPKPPKRKEVSSRSSERHLASATHHSSERRTPAAVDLPKNHSGTFTSAWGPEAKNSSVAKRLAQFLSDDKISKTRPRTETTTSTRTTKSVSFLERLTQLHDEPPPTTDTEGGGVSSPRIEALQDAQRESTYMGRIQAEKERVAKIRQARDAAEAIQRAWRRHCRSVN